MKKSIWFTEGLSLEQVAPLSKDTMAEHVGIEWLELAGDDFIRARMPVDQRTQQPHGLPAWGASVCWPNDR